MTKNNKMKRNGLKIDKFLFGFLIGLSTLFLSLRSSICQQGEAIDAEQIIEKVEERYARKDALEKIKEYTLMTHFTGADGELASFSEHYFKYPDKLRYDYFYR